MPRIFAIDWDRNEARALVLQSGPTGTSVTGVWAAKLDPPEGAVLNGKQVGARLAEVMGSTDVGKATTIVGVGRDHVQIKQLSLPPAPDDELPELVRFQAEREFTALGSEAALDYIPLTGDADTPHQVLAVALSPAGITESREVALAAGIEPDRITVRALATVSLVLRSGAIGTNAVSLVVNPLADEADLTVLDQGKVVLLRTVRLPDAEQLVARQRTLIGEIRRTVAAARQQSADRPVDQVLLCGNTSAVDHVDGLGDELGIPVTMFDPAAHAPGGLAGTSVSPQSLARFSAVLGMALSEADRRPPIVDFLNVRRRAEKQRFSRTHAMAAAAAAIVLLAVCAFLWRQHHEVASELKRVRAEIAEQRGVVEKFQPAIDLAKSVDDKWDATNVNWLDVLATVSERLRERPINLTAAEQQENPFPDKTDVVVKSMIFNRPNAKDGTGGEVKLTQAVTVDEAALNALASRLRKDPRLQVRPSGGRRDTSVPGYEWAFTLAVAVEKFDSREEPASASDSKAEDAAAPDEKSADARSTAADKTDTPVEANKNEPTSGENKS